MDFGLIILFLLSFVVAIGSLIVLVVSRGLLAYPVSARQKGFVIVSCAFFLLVGSLTYKVHYLDDGLMGAVGQQNGENAAYFLNIGADPNTDAEGETALMMAIMNDNASMVKLLIAGDADVNRESKVFGDTFGQPIKPLQAALKKKNPRIIRLLRDAGAKP